jgi:hypothetical protein
MGGGEAAPGCGRPAAARGRRGARRPEEEDGADGWAPSVGERERGGREEAALMGRRGPKSSARPAGWAGCFVFFFFLFFANPFQIFSNLSFISFQIKF